LIRELLDAGMSADAITVLVATGLHRPNLDEELAELVDDPWVLETVKVENHYARDDEAHVLVGTTSKGNIVRLDKRFVEADLKIATGLVEPHFMAGYSGGRKVIAPGVAHAETITTFHSARYMEHPLAANLVLDGNPLHEDQLEVVEMLGGAYAVNTVIDEQRRPAFLNYGEIVESHLAAVDYIRGFAEIPVDRKFKTVVTSCAGYPLDTTYYQTVKGMVGPLDIMAPGGDLIVISSCTEGMGSPEFVDAQRHLVELGPEGFLAAINKKTHADIDEWQTEMQLKPMRLGSIQLYSEALGDADWPLTGIARTHDVAASIAASIARSGDPNVAIIPEGPYVVPVFRPDA
jgi:nickel-dependent lactate racemase